MSTRGKKKSGAAAKQQFLKAQSFSGSKAVSPEARELEIESAKLFGKHVSETKAYVLLVFTLLACACPMLMGIRLWNDIPEVVASGLIGTDALDDSMPRWAIVFGLPGLMCVLDFICHMQLLLNQKRMTLPKTPVRLLGRWGFPIISVIFCSGMIIQSAGGAQALPLTFLTPCITGLVLMLLGAHCLDCPRTSKVSFGFWLSSADDACWARVHTFAAGVWLVVGLAVICWAQLTGTSDPACAVLILAGIVVPPAYAYVWKGRSL